MTNAAVLYPDDDPWSHGIAIGRYAQATGNAAIAIGYGALAVGDSAVAIGRLTR